MERAAETHDLVGHTVYVEVLEGHRRHEILLCELGKIKGMRGTYGRSSGFSLEIQRRVHPYSDVFVRHLNTVSAVQVEVR